MRYIFCVLTITQIALAQTNPQNDSSSAIPAATTPKPKDQENKHTLSAYLSATYASFDATQDKSILLTPTGGTLSGFGSGAGINYSTPEIIPFVQLQIGFELNSMKTNSSGDSAYLAYIPSNDNSRVFKNVHSRIEWFSYEVPINLSLVFKTEPIWIETSFGIKLASVTSKLRWYADETEIIRPPSLADQEIHLGEPTKFNFFPEIKVGSTWWIKKNHGLVCSGFFNQSLQEIISSLEVRGKSSLGRIGTQIGYRTRF